MLFASLWSRGPQALGIAGRLGQGLLSAGGGGHRHCIILEHGLGRDALRGGRQCQHSGQAGQHVFAQRNHHLLYLPRGSGVSADARRILPVSQPPIKPRG